MITNKSWLEENRTLVLILIFFFSLLVRFLTAEYLDLGGDNAQKWMQAHRLAEGMGVSYWYNHSMRWTIVLPLAGLIKLFGPNPVLTYIQPFFCASIAAVFICLIGQRVHSLKLGVYTAILSILLPQMVQSGSQLWPGIFEMACVAAMVWALMVWVDERKMRWLLLAGLIYFIGWGARVTILYVYPGAVMLIWLTTKDFKAIIVFTIAAAAPCFAEWGWFWYDSGNPMGRIGILDVTRGGRPELQVTFWEYLTIFKLFIAFKGLLPVLLIVLGTSVYGLWEDDRKIRGMAAFNLLYMLLSLYMISGINPLKLANRFGPRNWPEIAPYGFMVLLWMLFKLKERRPRVGVALIALLFVGFFAFTAKKIPATNTLVQMAQDYEVLGPAMDAGQPLRMVYEPWQPNLVEKVLIETFAGKRRRKEMNDQEVWRDMNRNKHRALWLFVGDPNQFQSWQDSEMVRQDKYVYLLKSPSDPTNMTPTVESRFGRRAHSARLLTAE